MTKRSVRELLRERVETKTIAPKSRDVDASDDIPTHTIIAGELPSTIDFAERTLAKHCKKLFQRGGTLVRIGRVEEDEIEHEVKRSRGSACFILVEPIWLTEQLAKHANWKRQGETGHVTCVDPPQRIARSVITGRAGEWKNFRTVSGIMRAPTILPDGTLLQRAGYDERSRVYFDLRGVDFQAVAEAPDQEGVRKAKSRFKRLLEGFPFKDETDEAVAMSAIMCGLVRPFMRACPLHIFDAPMPGTGKTLLAETIGIIVTGSTPASAAQGKTEEEDEKRLVGVLQKGDPVLLIDNVERPLGGQMLCQILTAQTVTSRILGTNLVPTLPTRILVMATGNNATVAGDMSRRAVVCRLDAGLENPERRTFDFDPKDLVKKRRPQYVQAALTLLKSWHEAEEPNKLEDALGHGGYEDWTRIRACLVYHGYADPLHSQQSLTDTNEALVERRELLSRWAAVIGSERSSLAKLNMECGGDDAGGKQKRLHKMLCELSRDGKWNARSIGKRLHRHVDAPCNGLTLRSKLDRNGVRQFFVEKRGN